VHPGVLARGHRQHPHADAHTGEDVATDQQGAHVRTVTGGGVPPLTGTVRSLVMNLPLRRRRIDIVFAVVFAAFTITSVISDLLPTIGVDFSHASSNFFAK